MFAPYDFQESNSMNNKVTTEAFREASSIHEILLYIPFR